jgi:hypothetical protein
MTNSRKGKPSFRIPMPSVPKPVYNPQQNIQIQPPTLGQSIKQGIGAGVGWSIGTNIINGIFGSNKQQITEKVTTCENLREMLAKTFDYQERDKLEKQIKENCKN